MTVQEAAHSLNNSLRGKDPNVLVVAIVENNVAAYEKNPERFVEKITADSLVVYTYKEPTKKELELTSYEGFAVRWAESGEIVLNAKS